MRLSVYGSQASAPVNMPGEIQFSLSPQYFMTAGTYQRLWFYTVALRADDELINNSFPEWTFMHTGPGELGTYVDGGGFTQWYWQFEPEESDAGTHTLRIRGTKDGTTQVDVRTQIVVFPAEAETAHAPKILVIGDSMYAAAAQPHASPTSTPMSRPNNAENEFFMNLMSAGFSPSTQFVGSATAPYGMEAGEMTLSGINAVHRARNDAWPGYNWQTFAGVRGIPGYPGPFGDVRSSSNNNLGFRQYLDRPVWTGDLNLDAGYRSPNWEDENYPLLVSESDNTDGYGLNEQAPSANTDTLPDLVLWCLAPNDYNSVRYDHLAEDFAAVAGFADAVLARARASLPGVPFLITPCIGTSWDDDTGTFNGINKRRLRIRRHYYLREMIARFRDREEEGLYLLSWEGCMGLAVNETSNDYMPGDDHQSQYGSRELGKVLAANVRRFYA